MTDELLRSATNALRLSSDAIDGDGGGATLARVLHTVRGRKRAQRLVAAVIVPLLLLIAAGGAWAISTGRLSAIWKRRTAGPVAGGAARGGRATVARAEPMVMPLPPLASPPAAAAAPAPAAAPAIRAVRRVAARLGGGAAPTDVEGLYREAHAAHFGRGDFVAALALWDRYLASTPLPPFAVEARFNRAIALLRLGRGPQAAAALRPFADGDYGSYRRDEARKLLSAIESGAFETH